ncbi:MAG: serine dehydratase subunit alpha family protein [Firmicutes bacterium]|nr:serine dehydratase subunit alpha family protein [Bacillota bacterium]
MERQDIVYKKLVAILHEELIPAMGCTEPVAIAYAGALARQTLGCLPERVEVIASGNLVKNVKSVVVPNTGGLKGIPAAVAAGIVAGDAGRELEVIASVPEERKPAIAAYLEQTPISVTLAETGLVLDLTVRVWAGAEQAVVRIAHQHTNVVYIQKNDQVLKDIPVTCCDTECGDSDRDFLTLELICDFADSVDLADVKELLDRQISFNMAICEEGLRGDYGANIGKVIRERQEDSLRSRCVSYAAAGSDARMNGCELPVVVNSGSGNQGITASVPVVVYARGCGAPEERLYRALVLSNLTAIYQKEGIGRLSAYCGAVNAGAAAACGVAYLRGGDFRVIAHTLVNTLAVLSGMVCDGAKASCAGKIVMAVEAGFLGYEMFVNGQQFRDGEGIVKKGVDNTVDNVGRLGRVGMRQADLEILRMMLGE